MNTIDRFREILATYNLHGWQLERVLMRTETLALLTTGIAAGTGANAFASSPMFEGVRVDEDSFDAMAFTRLSHAERTAWELRFVGETPYALFEMFETDEAEEDREEVRREMIARMRERVSGGV